VDRPPFVSIEACGFRARDRSRQAHLHVLALEYQATCPRAFTHCTLAADRANCLNVAGRRPFLFSASSHCAGNDPLVPKAATAGTQRRAAFVRRDPKALFNPHKRWPGSCMDCRALRIGVRRRYERAKYMGSEKGE
jgi:hypothetical protein